MQFVYSHLFTAIWVLWCAYWMIVSRNVKQTARSESQWSKVQRLVPLAVAALLLWVPTLPGGFLCEKLIPQTAWTFWIGAAITVAGLLFSVWARVHLGRNWSAVVTLKQEHELITSGPYGLVRHPIYTGLLVAFIGTAIARAEWRGVLAVALVLISFWHKLRLEEAWLTEEFGDVYRDYRRRVSALIPFVI